MIFPGLNPPRFWFSLGFSLTFHCLVFFVFSGMIRFFEAKPRMISIEVRIASPPTPAPSSQTPPPETEKLSQSSQAAPVLDMPRLREFTTRKNKPQTYTRQKKPRESPQESIRKIRELLKHYPHPIPVTSSNGTGDPVYDLPPGIEGRLYFQEVIAAIQSIWKVPPGIYKGSTELEVVLDSQGKILESRLLRSSGDPLLDSSAKSAVGMARFPPPPPGWRTPLRLKLILIPPEVP